MIALDEDARRTVERGVDEPADAVNVALGPNERNVELGRDAAKPLETNDIRRPSLSSRKHIAIRAIRSRIIPNPVALEAVHPLRPAAGQDQTPGPGVHIGQPLRPVQPVGGAHQLALDWCGKGVDVEFWTNEEAPS